MQTAATFEVRPRATGAGQKFDVVRTCDQLVPLPSYDCPVVAKAVARQLTVAAQARRVLAVTALAWGL
jgi:hypothetical protein